MSKIDNQMLQNFQRFTGDSNGEGKQVSQEEARVLMGRAQILNKTYTGSCSGAKNKKGNQSLKGLVSKYPDRFSNESKQDINYFITSGRMPQMHVQGYKPVVADSSSSSMVPKGLGKDSVSSSMTPRAPSSDSTSSSSSSSSYSSSSSSSSGFISSSTESEIAGARANLCTGGQVTNPGSNISSNISSNINRTPTGPVSPNIVVNTPTPVVNVNNVVPNSGTQPASARPANTSGNVVNNPNISIAANPRNPGSGAPNTPAPNANPVPTPVSSGPAPRVSGNVGVSTAFGTRILDWKAANPTWQCNWFPTQERTHLGGDPRYNLYAMDGALDKLDKVTGGDARGFEYSNHRKQLGAGTNFLWWGNCDKASTVACLFKQPKRAVNMKARDGSTVVFTPNDIQGLLVRAVSSMTAGTDFLGKRHNEAAGDDPMEPRPSELIEGLTKWCNDGSGLAQAWDIDPTGKVWNYPYDTIQIDESDKAPQGFDPSSLGGGSVKYYQIHASGNGYTDQVRNLIGYIQRDSSGAIIANSWILGIPNASKNIDFAWRPRPVPNLYDKSSWVLRGKPENPHVDMGVMYDIYMQSIA